MNSSGITPARDASPGPEQAQDAAAEPHPNACIWNPPEPTGQLVCWDACCDRFFPCLTDAQCLSTLRDYVACRNGGSAWGPDACDAYLQAIGDPCFFECAWHPEPDTDAGTEPGS